MKAAVYFLLVTFITLIAVVNSTCYCSSKTSLADIPSIFAHQQPSTFPVSLPLLSFDEILHHIPPSTTASNVHPFEDLFGYIYFEDGSCVYFMIEDFDVRSAVESTVSDIKESLPSFSEIKETAAPLFDAVEGKVSPIFSSIKDTIAPVLSAPVVSKAKDEFSSIIIESYKYGLEYTKNLQERVAPIISDIEDKAAFVVEDVIVEETIAPYISSESVEAEDNACESFSLSKFIPNVEVMTNSNNGYMENEVEEEYLTIPDEEDFILVIELVGDDEVAHVSPSEVYDVAPSHEDAPFLQTLFKLLCILAVGLTSLLLMLYVFVLSIVIYVFVTDYFAEKYDADANGHFRELLSQTRNEHCRRRPAVPLPAPPRKMNQEQQTDDEEEEENDGGDENYVIEPTDDVSAIEAPAAAASNDEGYSSEDDVSTDDTTTPPEPRLIKRTTTIKYRRDGSVKSKTTVEEFE